jgi:hypothetical protein
MTKGELDSFLTAKIKKPVPGEHAFHTYLQSLPVWCDDSEEFIRVAVDVTVDKDFSFPINNADEHFSGMKINSAVMFVCFGVKSHEGPLLD